MLNGMTYPVFGYIGGTTDSTKVKSADVEGEKPLVYLNNLIKNVNTLPPVTIDEQGPQLESDAYLESLLTENPSDVDGIDPEDADDMALGSQINYLVHCLLEVSISCLEMPLGKF